MRLDASRQDHQVTVQNSPLVAQIVSTRAILAGATLSDGTRLGDDNQEAEFEEWRKNQEDQESDD